MIFLENFITKMKNYSVFKKNIKFNLSQFKDNKEI